MNNIRLRLKEKPFSDRLPAEIKQHMDQILLDRDRRIDELEKALKHSNEMFDKRISELRRYVQSLEEFINRLNMEVRQPYTSGSFRLSIDDKTQAPETSARFYLGDHTASDVLNWTRTLETLVNARRELTQNTVIIQDLNIEQDLSMDGIRFAARYISPTTNEIKAATVLIPRRDFRLAQMTSNELYMQGLRRLAEYISGEESWE